MSRETVKAKAERYLLEGRIVLEEVTRHGITATVRGEGARYLTTWAGYWSCSCPHTARTTDCSHITACKRVVAIDIEPNPRRPR